MPSLDELFVKIGFRADLRKLEEARKKAVAAAEGIQRAHDKSAKDVAKALEDVASAVDAAEKKKAKARLRTAREHKAAHAAALRIARQSLKKQETAFKSLSRTASKSASSASEVWTGAMRRIGAAGVEALAGAGRAMVRFGIDSTAGATKTLQNAKKIGAGAEEYQVLLKSTELLGIESEHTFEAIKTFRENLGELARIGTGPAKDALGTLGLELKDIAGLPVGEQMEVLAQALSEIGDKEQLSVVIEAMGEDGQRILPFLRKGTQGMRDLGDAVKDAGAVLDKDFLEKADKTNKTLAITKQRIEGVGLQVVEAMLPAVEDGAGAFEDWIVDNDEFIKQDLPETLTAIAKASGMVADGVLQISSAFVAATKGIDSFVESFVEWDASLDDQALSFLGLITDSEVESRAASRKRVDKRGTGATLAGGDIRPDTGPFVGPTFDEFVGPAQTTVTAAQRAARRGKFGKEERKKALGGGRAGTKKIDTSGADAAFGDEIRLLAEKGGAGDAAVSGALEAAAQAGLDGSNRKVQREAALRKLGSATGQDLVKGSGSGGDPLLSSLLGEDVPDVELSAVARGAEPQVLISTINNTFNMDIDQNIEASGSPTETGNAAAVAMRDKFQGSIQKASKFTKLKFAR